MSKITRIFAAAIAVLALGIGFANAQDCKRGDLDKAYCDKNSDLVADTPDKTIDPPTLAVTYTMCDSGSYEPPGQLLPPMTISVEIGPFGSNGTGGV